MPVGSGGSSGASVVQESVLLIRTNAQIKALPTAGVQLVAAPGANKIIVPLCVVIRCDTSANGYTNIDANAGMHVGPTATDRLTTQLNEAASVKVSTLLAAFDNVFATLALDTPSVNEILDYANVSLSLWVPNGAAGAFTGGDAANSLSVAMDYAIVALA